MQRPRWNKTVFPHRRGVVADVLPLVFVALISGSFRPAPFFDLVWVMIGGGPGGATETASVCTYQT